MAHPIAEEPGGNVLGGIEAEAVDRHLLSQPAAPELQLFIDRAVAEFDIGAHQEIEIAEFLVHLLVPFAVAILVDQAEHAIFAGVFDAVHAGKALVVPHEAGMRAGAAGEGEAGVGRGVEGLVLDLGAVVGIVRRT
jgi:hypothetical protein